MFPPHSDSLKSTETGDRGGRGTRKRESEHTGRLELTRFGGRLIIWE